MDVIHEHALGWRKEKTSPSSHVTPNSQKLKTATVTSWFQPQSELFPYGERVGDSPRQQKQSKVKNPNYEEKTKKEITTPTPDVNARGGGARGTPGSQTPLQIRNDIGSLDTTPNAIQLSKMAARASLGRRSGADVAGAMADQGLLDVQPGTFKPSRVDGPKPLGSLGYNP